MQLETLMAVGYIQLACCQDNLEAPGTPLAFLGVHFQDSEQPLPRTLVQEDMQLEMLMAEGYIQLGYRQGNREPRGSLRA